MTVISIRVTDATNPVELQDWFDKNPTIEIKFVLTDGRAFFIFY